jgi:hypothetical protein
MTLSVEYSSNLIAIIILYYRNQAINNSDILKLLVRRVKARQFQTVILCNVQITSQLFALCAVCRGNNELSLVPWNKTLKYLNYLLALLHVEPITSPNASNQ